MELFHTKQGYSLEMFDPLQSKWIEVCSFPLTDEGKNGLEQSFKTFQKLLNHLEFRKTRYVIEYKREAIK